MNTIQLKLFGIVHFKMVDKEYDLLSTELLGFPLRDPELVPSINLGREDVRCENILYHI